jgi:surfactin synthase thioesterase subunit
MQPIRLFCLPFAGGSAYSYRNLLQYVSPHVKGHSIELPGRGERINESLLLRVPDMVEDIFGQIRHLLNEPYALYGHSMGALLAYLLTRKAIRENYAPPLHLFCTGRGSPSSLREKEHAHLLPREAFLGKILELGGSQQEVLEDDLLMEFFEPILRADFEAVDEYEYEASPPFSVPIVVVTGTEEEITDAEIRAWQQQTSCPLETIKLPGKHFFIFAWENTLAQLINTKLGPAAPGWLPAATPGAAPSHVVFK